MKIDYETGDSEADSSVQVTTENSKASQKYHTNQNSSNNSKNNSSNKNTTAAKTNIQYWQKPLYLLFNNLQFKIGVTLKFCYHAK